MLTPGAAPAGRALANDPATYTVFPTVTCDQTTPSICTVGSGSVATVAGSVPPTGCESAWAAGMDTASNDATTSPAEAMAPTIRWV